MPIQCPNTVKSSLIRIVDDPSKLISSGQHDVAFLSAHDLIHITNSIRINRPCQRRLTYRNFRNFNEEKFISEVRNVDWNVLMIADSISNKVEIFNSMVLGCLDRHVFVQQHVIKSSLLLGLLLV